MRHRFQDRLLMVSIFLIGMAANPYKVFSQAKYDIKEMTPEVQAALDNRRGRFNDLQAFKAKGLIGENNRGYVTLLKNDQNAQTLVEAENKDRKTIYKTIEKQNSLTNALETIEKVFAQVQRDKANPGEQIQTEDGQWVTK